MLDFAGEIEINKIRSFTQKIKWLRDLDPEESDSWPEKPMCVFWSNLKAITKALPDRFHLCTARAKQFL